MKNKILLGGIAGVIMLVSLTGCSTNQPTPQIQKCVIDNVNAPNWICNNGSNMKGGIYAVGAAEKSPLGLNFQKTEANAAARDVLTRQINIKVENMFKQFQATTGTGNEQTADKATQNVSKQIALKTLNDIKVINHWVSPKKRTYYILIELPNNKHVKQIFSNLRNKNNNKGIK